MRYPNLRYGNPTEFAYYAVGVPMPDLARRRLGVVTEAGAVVDPAARANRVTRHAIFGFTSSFMRCRSVRSTHAAAASPPDRTPDEVNSVTIEYVGCVSAYFAFLSVFIDVWVDVSPLAFEAHPAIDSWPRLIVVSHVPLADEPSFVTSLME